MKRESRSAFPRWASNFFPSNLVIDGISYPTVEHAFQATKTMDTTEKLRIAYAPTPRLAKRLGRKVAMRSDWEAIKYDVMLRLVRMKFETHPELAFKLVDTDDDLVETNYWHDNTWGVCTCLRCPGRGDNQLGKILMRVRRELMESGEK